MGPRARLGRKVRPPRIRMIPTSNPIHSPPVVGKELLVAAVWRLAARLPAIASTGTITKKRPSHLAMPVTPLSKGVPAERPATADTLFPALEVKASFVRASCRERVCPYGVACGGTPCMLKYKQQ